MKIYPCPRHLVEAWRKWVVSLGIHKCVFSPYCQEITYLNPNRANGHALWVWVMGHSLSLVNHNDTCQSWASVSSCTQMYAGHSECVTLPREAWKDVVGWLQVSWRKHMFPFPAGTVAVVWMGRAGLCVGNGRWANRTVHNMCIYSWPDALYVNSSDEAFIIRLLQPSSIK